jgi:hypothetical protein
MTPDQVNSAEWKGGWTNLLNDVRQTFVPSIPRLMAVEVELVVGNPGRSHDTLTLELRDSDGKPVAIVTRRVPASAPDHVVFVLPKGGAEVVPGTIYNIQLSGGPTFGWKYVEGGYELGSASFNGKPLLRKSDGTAVRSTFLFRTFGAA